MVRFTVLGKAAPAGSKRAFVVNGRAVVTDANKNSRPWKALVAAAGYDAILAFNGGVPLDGPLAVSITEYRVRPKGHFRVNGELSAEGLRRPYPTSAPDTGKISRGIHDALTGVVYRDDAQIVLDVSSKAWGDTERTLVAVDRMDLEDGPTVLIAARPQGRPRPDFDPRTDYPERHGLL